jgi:glycosyltransferase A (GT-A) superfamily protein (DUF2064 family)
LHAVTAIGPVSEQRVNICVMARAPVAGHTKTRLIPALGAVAAARLQRQLTLRTVEVALGAGIGDVTLWCAPDASHRSFRAMARAFPIALKTQCQGDLDARMRHIFEAGGSALEGSGSRHLDCAATPDDFLRQPVDSGGVEPMPLLLMGSDCPVFTSGHLREAADALRDGKDAVLTPAEDGGYVLIGLRRPQPTVFDRIDWSTDRVLTQTRERFREAGLSWHECPTLWDVDRPADLARLGSLADLDWDGQRLVSVLPVGGDKNGLSQRKGKVDAVMAVRK